MQSVKESDEIWCLLSLPDISFAVGLDKGIMKIYSMNESTQKYQLHKEYKHHSDGVFCLLYMPKHDLLLSGSNDQTEEKVINTLKGFPNRISYLISLNDDMFVSSSSNGEIKFWSIKYDRCNWECVKNIEAYDKYGDVYLNNISEDYIISRQCNTREFKIWYVKSFECVKTYIEDDIITRLMVTKNNSILAATADKKLNLWKIN